MKPPIPPGLFALLFLFGMLVLMEIGRQAGIRRSSKETEAERASLGTIEGAVFALFGLLMAFTFSGAASRFNEKRMLVAEEANTIETAYLRLRLLDKQAQPGLQELFRHYLDSRLETYHRLPNMEAAESEMARSKKIQEEIWTNAIGATRLSGSNPAAAWLLMPALNNMIDVTTTRAMALQTHPPTIIYALLFGLGLITALLAGYGMACTRQRVWLHIFGFTIVTAIVAYVILDVEYPRTGLFHLGAADEVLVKVRQGMN